MNIKHSDELNEIFNCIDILESRMLCVSEDAEKISDNMVSVQKFSRDLVNEFGER